MSTAIIGAILFFVIGAILSLIGSGGAILTIPLLVYVFKIDPYLATSYSMFIMGTSNLVATLDNIKRHVILYKPGLYFAVPGLIVTYSVRRFVLPHLPDILIDNSFVVLSKGNAIMLVFSILMFIAAIRALLGKKRTPAELPVSYDYKTIIFLGAAVGLVTGFVGAGGGFLIIPAFVFTLRTPMKYAVATSIFIIAITTSLGFLGDFNPSIQIDWKFLLFYMSCSVVGVLLTHQIKDRFSNDFLRLLYGYIIFVLAVFVSLTEVNKLDLIFSSF